MQPPATLRIRLGRSSALIWTLAGAHGAIAALAWLLPLKWWLACLISLAAPASLTVNIAAHATRSARWAVVGLELREDGSARALRRSGDGIDGVLLGSSFVSRRLVIVNLRPADGRFAVSIVVPWDSISAEDFRRLRVWLRWRVTPRSAGQ